MTRAEHRKAADRRIGLVDFKRHLDESFTGADFERSSEPYFYFLTCCDEAHCSRFKQFREALKEVAESKGADMEIVEENILSAKQVQGYTVDDTDEVLEKLNEVASDERKKDKVSVLPFACGLGKSRAISRKIREVLEDDSTDGLIIATYTREALFGYVHPKFDAQISKYFSSRDVQDQICVLTDLNYQTERVRMRRCKVLLITIQRFVRLSESQLSHYMTWEHGKRTLFIIDEEPVLNKIVDVTENDLGHVESALHMGLRVPKGTEGQSEGDKRIQYCQDYWENVKLVLCDWIHRKEADHRGERFVHYGLPDFDYDLKVYEQFRDQCKLWRDQLDNYLGALKTVNIYETIDAVYSFLRSGGVFRIRGAGRPTCFTVVLDYAERYQIKDVKVVILDGTANISPSYKMHPLMFDMADVAKSCRYLDRLRIRLVDYACGVRRMEQAGSEVFHDVSEDVISKWQPWLETWKNDAAQNPENGKKPILALFTNQSTVGNYGIHLRDEKGEPLCLTNYFGNIKGRNDYHTFPCITQVGLNLMPMEKYVLYAMEIDPEFRLKVMESTQEEQDRIVTKELNDPDSATTKVMNDFLLSDIEQNLFRGVIRNLVRRDYTYFLYFSHTRFSALVNAIKEHYEGQSASVEKVSIIPELQVARIMESGRENKLLREIIRAHDEFEVDQEVTTQQWSDASGMNNTRQFHDVYSSNPVVTGLMEKERKKKGRYTIKKPWYGKERLKKQPAQPYDEMKDELEADNQRDASYNITYLWDIYPERYQQHPDWVDD